MIAVAKISLVQKVRKKVQEQSEEWVVGARRQFVSNMSWLRKVRMTPSVVVGSGSEWRRKARARNKCQEIATAEAQGVFSCFAADRRTNTVSFSNPVIRLLGQVLQKVCYLTGSIGRQSDIARTDYEHTSHHVANERPR